MLEFLRDENEAGNFSDDSGEEEEKDRESEK